MLIICPICHEENTFDLEDPDAQLEQEVCEHYHEFDFAKNTAIFREDDF